MATRSPVETPPNETRPLPDGSNAYRFDGLGRWFPKGWDLTEGGGSEFCWYHVQRPDGGEKLEFFNNELTEALRPHLRPQDITRMVRWGPFCGHVNGALFIRVNSSGPALSEFSLRLAARVTEKLVITVSSGPDLNLVFTPSGQSHIPDNPNRRRNDEAETSYIVNVERETESLLTMNPEEADTPVPKTVGTLLLRIADRYMDHLQETVTGLEIKVDDIVHGIRSRPFRLEEPHTVNGKTTQ